MTMPKEHLQAPRQDRPHEEHKNPSRAAQRLPLHGNRRPHAGAPLISVLCLLFALFTRFAPAALMRYTCTCNRANGQMHRVHIGAMARQLVHGV